MRYEDSIDEAIWIERTVNNLTYREIQEKIGVSYYRIKKVINERSQGKNKTRGRKRNEKKRRN